MIKADLHLHSHASNKSAGFFSKKIGINESYVNPLDLYNTLFERGMTHFTITDHDTIEGCLEIAHLPNTFVSEEVTAYFPEDRCKIHVLVYEIDEKIHDDLSRARYNVYELVDYLQENNLLHSLAHPLYDMDGKLSRDHIERFLLLFDNWEVINGTRSKLSSILTKDIATRYSPQEIDQLAEKHGFNKRRQAKIGFTAGSDDHGGLDLGLTYTECDGETLEDLRLALQQNRTVEQGIHGSPTRLTHMIMNIAYSGQKENTGNLGLLFDNLFGDSRTKSIIENILGVNKTHDYIRKVAGQNFDFKNDNKHDIIHGFFKNYMPYVLGQFTQMKNFQFEQVSMLIGKSLFSILPNVFYVSTYWQRALEKKRSLEIHRSLTGDRSFDQGKVAYFTDTMFEINGVAKTSMKLFNLVKQEQMNMKFITCYDDKEGDDYLKNFEPLLSFPVPEYPELKVNVPNFLDLLEYCDEQNFEVIYASTPGIVGLYGFFIARILHLPFVTTFHTDFPSYAGKYTNDHLFMKHVWNLFAGLYNNSTKVLSPSREYERILISKGVKRNKIETFKRGVNHEKYNPGFRNRDYWREFDPEYNDETVVLYVGRVAKEKNLEMFLATYELLRDREDVRFAIVGDGPFKEEIFDAYKDHIIFTGYQEGESLSTAYASADIFFFPSMTETFGNVVLEAQACGLPCVISNQGATKENINPNVTGFVIDQNNAASYAEPLRQLLDSPNKLQIMRQNCIDFTQDFKERELLLEMLERLSLKKLKKKNLLRESIFA